MFDINGAEFIVLAVIVLIVVGPERLPQYASQLGRMVRELRKFAVGAREQVRAELGPDFDNVDWTKLDPRQYDPRRIVREALQDAWDEDEPVTRNGTKPVSDGGPGQVDLVKGEQSSGRRAHRALAPFDTEAT